jgi:hypothetical protein
MRASVMVLAAILGVAQLAGASPPSETLQSARVARDGFYRCALMTVPEYDDRISPANVAAKATAFKCQSWVNAMLRHVLRDDADEQCKEIMRGDEGNLLGIVLRNRRIEGHISAAGCGYCTSQCAAKVAPTRNARP